MDRGAHEAECRRKTAVRRFEYGQRWEIPALSVEAAPFVEWRDGGAGLSLCRFRRTKKGKILAVVEHGDVGGVHVCRLVEDKRGAKLRPVE